MGGGPGFVTIDLRERVGPEGNVTILEPSSFYLEYLQTTVQERGWNNVHLIRGTAETTKLPDSYFDLVFVRWVIAFVPDPELFLKNLAASLKPGGIIALQDYYYEGISLYPHGAFNRVPEAVIRYYRSQGGDPYITGSMPSLFRKFNIQPVEYSPHCLAGGPTDAVTEWASRFFTLHIPIMAERGIISADERDVFLNDWYDHRRNPDMLFFSPIVVDVAGKKL